MNKLLINRKYKNSALVIIVIIITFIYSLLLDGNAYSLISFSTHLLHIPSASIFLSFESLSLFKTLGIQS